jgi:hypothetical protein
MDDSRKLFAPKPIKNKPNPNGLKIITEFERIKGAPFKTFTPICKSRPLTFKKSLSDNVTYSNFEKDIRDSSSTSEILSILNTRSTGFDSMLYPNINEDFNEDSDYLFIDDDIRTSMPPMRSKNPFAKNFNSAAGNMCYQEELIYDSNYGYFDELDNENVITDPK